MDGSIVFVVACAVMTWWLIRSGFKNGGTTRSSTATSTASRTGRSSNSYVSSSKPKHAKVLTKQLKARQRKLRRERQRQLRRQRMAYTMASRKASIQIDQLFRATREQMSSMSGRSDSTNPFRFRSWKETSDDLQAEFDEVCRQVKAADVHEELRHLRMQQFWKEW